MADNTVINPGAGGDTIATDDVGGVKFQRTKVVWGVDGVANDANATTPLPVTAIPYGPTAVTGNGPSAVAAAITDTQLIAANAARKGVVIFNDSSATLYVLLGTAVASATNFTVKVLSGGYYEVPYNYTGQIKGIWSSAIGSARVTEVVA